MRLYNFSSNSRYVILSAQGVDGQEVARETVAEPIARFRLRHPVFPLAPVGERPCVEVARYIERPLWCQAYLCAYVYRGACVVKEVGFHRDVLGTHIAA